MADPTRVKNFDPDPSLNLTLMLRSVCGIYINERLKLIRLIVVTNNALSLRLSILKDLF